MTKCNRRHAPLLAALSSAMLLAHADAQPPSGESAAMSPSESASTIVEGEDGAKLQAAFDLDDAKQRLSVRYRVDNTGDAPLAVFDRGNAHPVLTKRQKPGGVRAVVQAGWRRSDIEPRPMPLPTPAPTVPSTPLAAKLEPARSRRRIDFNLSLADARARALCLGVARSRERVHRIEQGGGVQVWAASSR